MLLVLTSQVLGLGLGTQVLGLDLVTCVLGLGLGSQVLVNITDVTPIFKSLHWLKINERIEYKLLSLTLKLNLLICTA